MIDVPTSGIGIWQDWPAPTGYYYEPGQWEMNGAVRQSLGDLTCSTTGGKRYGANRTVKIA